MVIKAPVPALSPSLSCDRKDRAVKGRFERGAFQGLLGFIQGQLGAGDLILGGGQLDRVDAVVFGQRIQGILRLLRASPRSAKGSASEEETS